MKIDDNTGRMMLAMQGKGLGRSVALTLKGRAVPNMIARVYETRRDRHDSTGRRKVGNDGIPLTAESLLDD